MHPLLEKLYIFGGLSKYKLLWTVAIFIILIILISGVGIWFYKIKRSSLEYAVTNINKALEEENLILLSNYVDFNSFSKSFVYSILQYWPNLRINEKRQKELEDNIQQVILLALKNESNSQNANPTPTSNTPFIQRPDQKMLFRFLPEDFLKQLKEKKINIYRQDKDIAILKTSIVHKEARYHVELSLLAQRLFDKWQITKVINSDELIKVHMDALEQRESQLEHEVIVRNNHIRVEMNKYYYVSDCKAFVTRHENNDDNDVPLTISIGGVNMGNETLRSAGMRCFLYDINRNIIAVLPLSTVKNVLPGDFFEQKWYMEIPKNVLGHSFLLMKDNSLSCSIEVTTVILNDGTFLYLIPTLEKERIHP